MGGSAGKPQADKPVISSSGSGLSIKRSRPKNSLENKAVPDGMIENYKATVEENDGNNENAIGSSQLLQNCVDNSDMMNDLEKRFPSSNEHLNEKETNAEDDDRANISSATDQMTSTQHEMLNNSVVDEDDNSNHTNSDSVDLPYQYLIEKDIERELENSRNASRNDLFEVENSSKVICDSSNTDQIASKSPRDCRKNNKLKSRQESRESDSLSPPEVVNLRSSNITDLVMKGLMFTIRQDKDTVTVVEQKTKLEVDEVLENSEKVETKEGDPCLLNLSLLKMEKMITRIPPVSQDHKQSGFCGNAFISFIDSDINTEKDHSTNEINAIEDSETHTSIQTPEITNYWCNFFTNNDFMNMTVEKDEKVPGTFDLCSIDENQDDDLQLEMEDDDDDDEMGDSFEDSAFNAIKNSLPNISNLLENTNGVSNIEDSKKGATELTSDSTKSDSNMNEDIVFGDSSYSPKMKSNQIITKDQMHPALRHALKNQPSNQIPHSHDDSNANFYESNENNSEKCNGMDNENIATKMKADTDQCVKQDIKSDKSKLERYCKKNAVNNGNVDHSIISGMVTTKSHSSNTSENCRMNSNLNSNNQSSSVDSVRTTRSNTKMLNKCNGILTRFSVNDAEYERPMKTRTQKTIDKNHDENKDIGYLKRKSINDRHVSKLCKTDDVNEFDKKIVNIDSHKLLSDLKYGVQVVVERLNINKSRK